MTKNIHSKKGMTSNTPSSDTQRKFEIFVKILAIAEKILKILNAIENIFNN